MNLNVFVFIFFGKVLMMKSLIMFNFVYDWIG